MTTGDRLKFLERSISERRDDEVVDIRVDELRKLVALARAALSLRQQLLDMRPTSMLQLARANMLATIEQALNPE